MGQISEPYYSRINDVIRAIEEEKVGDKAMGFDMSRWKCFVGRFNHPCGTVACIGGFAETIGRSRGEIEDAYSEVDAYYWLTGLHEEDIEIDTPTSLFYPSVRPEGDHDGICCESATKEQAIKVLRHFQETGQIDWTVAL